jgi:hypothetical protein
MGKVLGKAESIGEFVTGGSSARREHMGIEREVEVKASGIQNPLRDLCPWINTPGLVSEEGCM